jgi:glycogen debranching enzyme
MQVMPASDTEIVRAIHWEPTAEGRQALVHKEWLVTNGLGGYASGTLSGGLTRRYHGLLVAALASPFGRTMMLSLLRERIRLPDGRWMSMQQIARTPDGVEIDASTHLEHFRLEAGLPVWTYAVEGVRVERRVLMPHLQNTTHVRYQLLSGDPVRLELQPFVAFRLHEAAVSHPLSAPYALHAYGDRFEIDPGDSFPALRLFLYGESKTFAIIPSSIDRVTYALEQRRGYDSSGAELVLAADQFIITPAGRVEEAARARAAGDEVRTVIAGYHWFTDWGRDTMISLEGLTLCTGRHREAGYILRTFGTTCATA